MDRKYREMFVPFWSVDTMDSSQKSHFFSLGSWQGVYKIYMKEQSCQKLKKNRIWGHAVSEIKIYWKLVYSVKR